MRSPGEVTLPLVAGGTFPHFEVDGKRVLVLCANNYLGLSQEADIVDAAGRALRDMGVGNSAGRSLVGNTAYHEELERRIAALNGFDRAILFNSAYMANLGLLSGVYGSSHVIFSDELNHASIIDGCRLSRAETKIFRHLDLGHLDRLLAETPSEYQKVIVSDGVFSMEGEIAPLRDLVEIKRRHDAILVVDDAHGVGVLGARGGGSIEHFDLSGHVDVQVGTLGKSLGGALGGFVAGSNDTANAIIRNARNFIYTNPIPAVLAAASIAAVEFMTSRPERLTSLRENARTFRSRVRMLGLTTCGDETPIVPIMLGDEAVARKFSELLLHRQVYVAPMAYPIVPKGKARLRCVISAVHSPSDLDMAVEALHSVGREMKILQKGAH